MDPTHDAQEIRNAHIKHEAAVRSIGVLYYLASIFSIIGGIGMVLSGREKPPVRFVVGPLLVLLAYAYWKLGGWFRSLDPKAKNPGTILACVGLLGIPIGTIINAYVLYLLHSQKGKVVFSSEYRSVVAATPDIVYRTSRIVWFLIYFTAAIILIVVLGALFGK